MENFKIPVAPNSTQKSIRFPNYIIEEVEDIIKGKNCSFSAFVVEATRIAVKQLKIEEIIDTKDDDKASKMYK